MNVTLHHGDCLAVLRTLPDCSVDACVTDPPYGLAEHKPAVVTAAITAWTSGDREHVPDGRGFMGRAWDGFVPPPAVWDECLRVLKPGGHLLCFAGTRTVDLMGLSIRLAGFEIRDSISWLYGSGFPKSLDVSKAIDKAAGAEREVVGPSKRHGGGTNEKYAQDAWTRENAATMGMVVTAPATDAAKQWAGFGTALKPASEPIIVARKPLVGTVAANVQAHGTGALNIDGCRIAGNEDTSRPQGKSIRGGQWSGDGGRSDLVTGGGTGRWPTNVVLDEHAAAELDQQSGTLKSGLFKPEHADNGKDAGTLGAMAGRARETATYGDSGGASRFFPVFKYQAKAPTKERPKVDVDGKQVGWPTVKPLELMRWLVRLVTPPGGVVLDPFAGTGTTGQAAELEGFASVLIERDELALRLIRERLGEVVEVGAPVEVAEPVVELEPAVELEPVAPPTLLDLINQAGTNDEFTALWRAHRDEWTDEHTAVVKSRLEVAA